MELINDILSDINKDPTKLALHVGNNFLRNILEAAYLPEKKWLLPEGVPPFKELQGPAIQHANNFWLVAKKVYVYSRADLKPFRRESLFIQDLENVCKEEATILLAVKDQTLDKLYPNLTKAFFDNHKYFNKE